jgi:hypothetical protein
MFDQVLKRVEVVLLKVARNLVGPHLARDVPFLAQIFVGVLKA